MEMVNSDDLDNEMNHSGIYVHSDSDDEEIKISKKVSKKKKKKTK